MAKQNRNHMEVNKLALNFVKDYIATKPLGLPADLTDSQFEVIMDAITRAMLQAWGDGYYLDR